MRQNRFLTVFKILNCAVLVNVVHGFINLNSAYNYIDIVSNHVQKTISGPELGCLPRVWLFPQKMKTLVSRGDLDVRWAVRSKSI